MLYRLKDPFDRLELESLRLDGLLRQVSAECWAPRADPLTPVHKAAALRFPSLEGIAASHRTAAWIWWGDGLAPEPAEFSTIALRRIRGQRACIVHEAHLGGDDVTVLDGIAVTTPVRTLVDLIAAAAGLGEDLSALAHGASPHERQRAREVIQRMRARPHLRAMRRLAARLA